MFFFTHQQIKFTKSEFVNENLLVCNRLKSSKKTWHVGISVLCIQRFRPFMICDLLSGRDSCVNSREKHKLTIPSVDTTRYGLHSFCYFVVEIIAR